MQKTFILSLLLSVVAVIFAVQNAAKVTIVFLFWKFEMHLALVIIFSLAIGAILGILFSLPGKIRKKAMLKDQASETASDSEK